MNESYQTYLESDEWKKRRELALEAAGRHCQVCNGSDRLEVHHRTYARVRAELPEDLIVLCRECHGTFHGQQAKVANEWGESNEWDEVFEHLHAVRFNATREERVSQLQRRREYQQQRRLLWADIEKRYPLEARKS